MSEGETEAPLTVRENRRLYTISGIGWVTFLGGPLAAAYLLAHNFRALGQPEHARRTQFGALAVLVVLFGVLALLPQRIAEFKWLQLAVAGAWTAAAGGIAEVYQAAAIRAHVKAGGREGSGLVAIGVMIGGLALTLFLAMLIFAAAPPFEGRRFEVPNTDGVVYYSGSANEGDASAVADLLSQLGYFSAGVVPANLVGDEDGLDVWLALDPAVWDDPGLRDEAESLATVLEERTGRSTRISVVADELSGRRVQVIRQRSP